MKLRQRWKTFVICFVIVVHLLVVAIARIFLYGNELRSFILSLVQRNCKVGLAILGVEVEVVGREHWRPGQNYLVVANHMSYLDALVFGAFHPFCFVTSVEMKESPGIGLCTEAGGCLYVERRNKQNIAEEIKEIKEALEGNFSVAIFPESTSTDGSKVLPFKRPLFAAAIFANRPVLPVILEYESVDGHPLTAENHAAVCWYGDMDFGPHLFQLTGYHHIKAKLTILPELPISAESSRDNLAEAAHEAIASQYKPIS
jgi:lyso-ornithine lipid O-acyltransferase